MPPVHRKLSATALSFNNGSKPRVGIKKGGHHRAEFQKDTQLLMMKAIQRAMNGQTGELEDKMFKEMTTAQRWAVINYWMKFVLPTQVNTNVSGELGLKKIEISYEELAAPRFELIENQQQERLEEFNEGI